MCWKMQHVDIFVYDDNHTIMQQRELGRDETSTLNAKASEKRKRKKKA